MLSITKIVQLVQVAFQYFVLNFSMIQIYKITE